MDLWYNAVPTAYKARKHYNELVLELYRGVWEETQHRMKTATEGQNVTFPVPTWSRSIREQWKELVLKGSLPTKWTRHAGSRFALPGYSTEPTIAFVVARRLLLRHWLLVFDEIQLLDVSSATLLADMLSWYWRMGGIIVGTSNKVPDDLYKNGVQRDRLEPFVEALKIRCPVVSLNSKHDWREYRASNSKKSGKTWYTLPHRSEFDRQLCEITGSTGISQSCITNVARGGSHVSL